MPLAPALGRQRQTSEFEANLVYKASSGTVRDCYTEKPYLKKNKTKQKRSYSIINKNKIYKITDYHAWCMFVVLDIKRLRPSLKPGDLRLAQATQ